MKIYRGYCEVSVNQNSKQGVFSYNVYEENKKLYERSCISLNITNNRLELLGIIYLIDDLLSKGFSQKDKLIICTTLKTIPDAIDKKWIENWKSNGWKTKDTKEVKNKDLWSLLHDKLTEYDIKVIFEKKNSLKLMKKISKNNRKTLKMKNIFDID